MDHLIKVWAGSKRLLKRGVAPQPEKMGTKAGSFCDFYFKLFQQEV